MKPVYNMILNQITALYMCSMEVIDINFKKKNRKGRSWIKCSMAVKMPQIKGDIYAFIVKLPLTDLSTFF